MSFFPIIIGVANRLEELQRDFLLGVLAMSLSLFSEVVENMGVFGKHFLVEKGMD